MNPEDAAGGDLPVLSVVPCRHLRNKGMYVYTDGASRDPHEGYDSTIYWCLMTMKGFGPDDDMVGGEECRDINRACYEPL